MNEMPMPGGWTMSMAWMRMPGQSWAGAAAMFIGMWMVMMVAMMLPSLVPMLLHYRRIVGTDTPRPGRLTTLVAVGYFFVWTVVGTVVFIVGFALAEILMQEPVLARAIPMASGVLVLLAGALQFTAWKQRHLSCCRPPFASSGAMPADAATACRYGVRLGLHCVQCCAGLIALLLIAGVMNLAAMVTVTVAITLERLMRAGERVARLIGIVIVSAGLLLIVRAAGIG